MYCVITWLWLTSEQYGGTLSTNSVRSSGLFVFDSDRTRCSLTHSWWRAAWASSSLNLSDSTDTQTNTNNTFQSLHSWEKHNTTIRLHWTERESTLANHGIVIILQSDYNKSQQYLNISGSKTSANFTSKTSGNDARVLILGRRHIHLPFTYASPETETQWLLGTVVVLIWRVFDSPFLYNNETKPLCFVPSPVKS